MAETKLYHEDVEMFANQLMAAGILTQRDYNLMWSNERRGMRDNGEPALNIEDVIRKVSQGGLSNAQMDQFDALAEEQGATVVRGEWEAVREAMGREHRSLFGDFKAGLSQFPKGLEAISDFFDPVSQVLTAGMTQPGELGGEGNRQSVIDLTRALKEGGYGDLPMTLFRNAESMDEVLDIVMDKTDMTPDQFKEVMVVLDETRIHREQQQAGIEDDQAANEAMDDKNLEDPLYAKNMRAYEILETNFPTKYQFDDETGAIYLTNGDGQVDRSGNIVQYGSDKSIALVGGWGELGEPNFTREEPFDGHEGGLAYGKETGWEKMMREMGAGSVVTEGQYFDVLDVINNKAGYGADPSRYLPGAADFLGGYESTYRVKVEETQARKDMRDRLDRSIGGISYKDFLTINDASAFYDDMKRWTSVDARRPSYDNNDEWAQFAGLSPENVAAVQKKMIDVGALDADEVVMGSWGQAEATQMYKWMDIANAKGETWQNVDEELIRKMFEDEGAATSRRGAFVPDAYRPMDPARVEVTVKDSIRQLLGRDATAQDLQQLGGYLSDTHGASYQADVKAARAKYNTQVSLDDAEPGAFGQPGAVEDVDFEARYITEMEKRFAPQLESQQLGIKSAKQQDMGVAMSNLMNRMGGGI